MPSAPKVLVLALDAAEPTVIEKWASEGRLPHLGRLLSTAGWSRMGSPAEQFPDEVWPTIYTSTNTAQHGKYFYIQPRRGSENLELVDDTPLGDQFWKVASRAGRRCAVVDPPKTALWPELNGVYIANWGAHATHAERASKPEGLLDELARKHGDYPIDSCDNHGRSPREYAKLRERMIKGVRRRGAVLRDLIARERWDLFFAVFSETHCSGHQFWHFQDPRHPDYDADDRHGLRTAMADVYAAVDEEIGRTLELAGPDTHVLVFSGHGMGPQYHGRDLIPTLLRVWGLKGLENVEPDPSNEKRIRVRRGLVQWAKETVPVHWQYAIKNALPKPLEDAIVCRVMGSKKLDPTARVNYVPNNDLNPAFRVNLKGRDPHGIVEPGREYDELLAWLTERLEQLINPATGKPALGLISRPGDMYQGPHQDILPDLTAMWRFDGWIGEVHSPGYGVVSGGHHDLRTGGHDRHGFLVYEGPGEPDFSAALPSGKDVAPTVLRLLGLDPPGEMEGRTLVRSEAAVRG